MPDRTDHPTQIIRAVGPRGRCLPVSDLLEREQHGSRAGTPPDVGRMTGSLTVLDLVEGGVIATEVKDDEQPAPWRRRMAGACAGLLAICGAVVIGEVIADSPQDGPPVERRDDAAPEPKPRIAKPVPTTARAVVQAAVPTPEAQPPARQQPEEAKPRRAEKRPSPAAPSTTRRAPEQWEREYLEMMEQLRKQYGQGG